MFRLSTELPENEGLLIRKSGLHVNGTADTAAPVYGNNERHCIECCRMRRPEFYLLRDGSLYAVSLSGDIYYLPPDDIGSDGMMRLFTAQRYFSWRLSVTDAPRLVDFISSCGAADDASVVKRYREVLSSVSTDPGNPPEAISPLQNSLIGFQTDYDRCVIFRDGQLVYEGDYDGRAFPLMFNYKDRDIYTKDDCWLESHQVHIPQLDKSGKIVFRLFDDNVPCVPDSSGQPQLLKYLGINGERIAYWSEKAVKCMEQHYANPDVEPYDLKDGGHTENTEELHSPVPMISDRSETVYLYGQQWERQFCDDGNGGKKPAAVDDEGKCGYATAVWTRGIYAKYNHYIMPFNDPEKTDRHGKVLETGPELIEASSNAAKMFKDPQYDDDYPLLPRNALPDKDCGTASQNPPPEHPRPAMCEAVDLFKGEECYWGYPLNKGENFKYSAADKIQGFRLIPCGNYSKVVLNNPAVNISKWYRLVGTAAKKENLPEHLPKDWTLAKEFGKEPGENISDVPVDDFGFPQWWSKYIESYYIYGAGKNSSWQYKTLQKRGSGTSKADAAWKQHTEAFNSENDCQMDCSKPPKWEDIFDTTSLNQEPMLDGDYEVKFRYEDADEEVHEQIILIRIENHSIVRMVINGVFISRDVLGDWCGDMFGDEQTQYDVELDLQQRKNGDLVFFEGSVTAGEKGEPPVEYVITDVPFPDDELVPRWWERSKTEFVWEIKGDGSGTDDSGKPVQYKFNEPVTEQIKKHCFIKTAKWKTNHDAYAEPPVVSDNKDKNSGYGILRYDVFRVGTSGNDYDNDWYWFDGVQWNKGIGTLGDLLNSDKGASYLLLHKDDNAVSICKERRIITAATPIQCCNDFLLAGLGTDSTDRQVYHKWDTIKRATLEKKDIQPGKENFVCCDTWFAFTMQTGSDSFHSRFYAFADENALPVLVWSADTNAEEAVQWGSCSKKCRYVFGRQTDKKGKLFYSTKVKGSWAFVHDYHILNNNTAPEAGCRSNGSVCRMPCEAVGGSGEETFVAGVLRGGCTSETDEQIYNVAVSGSGEGECAAYTGQGTVEIKKTVAKGIIEVDVSGVPYFDEIDDPSALMYPLGTGLSVISETHSATSSGEVTYTNCPDSGHGKGMTCSGYEMQVYGLGYAGGGGAAAHRSASIWTAYDFQVNPLTNKSEYAAGNPDLHLELGYKALVVVQVTRKFSPSDTKVFHKFKCYSIPDCRLRDEVVLTTEELSGGVQPCMNIGCTNRCSVLAKGASIGTHSLKGRTYSLPGGGIQEDIWFQEIKFQTLPPPSPNNPSDSPEKPLTVFAPVEHHRIENTDNGLGMINSTTDDYFEAEGLWRAVDPFTGKFIYVSNWKEAATHHHTSSNMVNTIQQDEDFSSVCVGSRIYLGGRHSNAYNEGSYCASVPKGWGVNTGFVYQSTLNINERTVGSAEYAVSDKAVSCECPNGIYCANGVAFFDGGKVRVIIHPDDGAWTYTVPAGSAENLQALNCCGRYSIVTVAGAAKLYYEDRFVKEVPLETTVNACCYKAGLIYFPDGHHEAYCEGEKLNDDDIWYGEFASNIQAVDIICDKDYYIWTHKEVSVERQYVNPEYTGSNVIPDAVWKKYGGTIEEAASEINKISGDWSVSVHSKGGEGGAEPVKTMLLSDGYWRFIETGSDAFNLAETVHSKQEILDWLLEYKRDDAKGILLDDTEIIAASFDGIVSDNKAASGGLSGEDDGRKTITFLADRFKTIGLAKPRQEDSGRVSEFGQWEYIVHYSMIHTPMHEIANGLRLIKNERTFSGIASAFYRTNHLFKDKRLAQVKRYCEQDEDGRDIEETSLGTYYFYEDQYLTDLGDIISETTYGDYDENREWHTVITAVKECNQPNGNFGWNNRLTGEPPLNETASLENVFKKSIHEDVLSWVKNTEYPHCGREMVRPVPYTKQTEQNDKVTVISYDSSTFNEVMRTADKWWNGIVKMRPMGVYVYNQTNCLSLNPRRDAFSKEFEDHTAGAEIENTKYLTYNDRSAAVRWDRAAAWESIVNSECGPGWNFKRYAETLLADEPYTAAPLTYQNGRLIVSGGGVLNVISHQSGLMTFDTNTGRAITDETQQESI